MKGVILGFAVLIGLALDSGGALAQNPYGVGGYLERPYDLGEESDAEQARRVRRRPTATDPQVQQQQPQAPQQTQPQAPGPAAAVAPQQQQQPGYQPNPSSQQQGAPRRPTQPGQQPAGAPQQQQPAQRPAPAAEPRRTPRPAQEAAQRERERDREREAERADSDAPLPPIPLRRPEFIEPPVSNVAALAAPQTPPDATGSLPPSSPDAAEAQAAASERTPFSSEPAASAPAPQASIEPESQPAASMMEPSTPAPPAAVTEAPPAPEAPPLAQTATSEQTPPPAESVAPETGPTPSAQAAAESVPAAAPAIESPPPAEPKVAEPAPLPDSPIQQAAAELAALAPAETPKPEALPPAQTAAAEPAEPQPVAAQTPSPPAPMQMAPAEPAPPAPEVVAEPAKSPAEAKPTAPAAMPPAETAPASAPKDVAAATAPPAPAEASPDKAAVSVPMPVQMARVIEEKPLVPQAQLRETSALDRMIGQMLLVGFRGLAPDEAWPQKLAAQIKAGTIGGVLIMSHNIQSPQQLKALTSSLKQAKSDIPLLLAVDQEGGIVQRLSAEKGFQTYPTAGKIGQSNDPLTAYSIYGRLATELTRYGFNMNLGPVVDLNRNEDSPIIAGKERSFGAQPKHVTAFAKAFIMAHQAAGMLTVMKHFPGHGSTPFDTHAQPVTLGSEWDQAELEPYDELIKSRTAQAVMVGHIANAAMSEEPGLPASLSVRTIQEVLRRALGFTGVVISDDLEMGAIRARYSLEESAVKALKAGNDMIILSNQNAPSPDMPERIVAAVRKAVESGEISREAVQASYDRIISLKQQLPSVAARNGGASKRAASAERGRAASAAAR